MRGAPPKLYPGDTIRVIIHPGDRGHVSLRYEGMEGEVVENMSRIDRLEGKKVSCSRYRVYLPEVDKEVNFFMRNLELVKSVEGKRRMPMDTGWGEVYT